MWLQNKCMEEMFKIQDQMSKVNTSEISQANNSIAYMYAISLNCCY